MLLFDINFGLIGIYFHDAICFDSEIICMLPALIVYHSRCEIYGSKFIFYHFPVTPRVYYINGSIASFVPNNTTGMADGYKEMRFRTFTRNMEGK